MSYRKQTFIDNTTVLTAAHLEHIEDGIYENSLAVEKAIKTVNGVKPDSDGNVTLDVDNGSLTAEEVQAMIDASLGVIANGSY